VNSEQRRCGIVASFRTGYGKAGAAHAIIEASGAPPRGYVLTACGIRRTLRDVRDFKRGSGSDVTCRRCQVRL
jgi:hypothetical protein